MGQNKEPTTNTFPWKEILGFFAVVLAAYIGYLGIRSQVEIPMQATQTAEARLTQLAIGSAYQTLSIPTETAVSATPISALTYTPYPTPTSYPTPIPPTAIIIIIRPTSAPPTAIPPTEIPTLLTHTATVYTQQTDGGIGVVACNSDWSICRNAQEGNIGSAELPVITIGANLFDNGFNIARAFLFFDTSQIPNNAKITGAILYLYAGQWLNGNKTIQLVPSFAGIPLSSSDYARVQFVSGGNVTFGDPFTWVSINLSQPALDWIVKGGITKLALIHDNDLRDITPVGQNDVLIATTEDQPHAPYLVITYDSP